MKSQFKKNILPIIFFSCYFFVGILTFKDYGIGIEEHFQRSSGLYWLNEVIQFTDFENLKNLTETKLNEIKDSTPNLPPAEKSNHYGIVFDLPAAAIESFLKVENSQTYFYFRHFMSFLFFFISGVLFYFILRERVANKFIPILGSIIYLFNPRVYGSSFFDGKDLFFLSILTITLFFYFKFERNKKISNLIIFSLFCALSTSSRIIGLIIPISFLFLLLLELLNNREFHKKLKILLIFLSSYLFFLYIHWPYLWTLNFSELINFFETFKVLANIKVFFNGNFYESNQLPLSYMPLWIAISTPIFFLLLFFLGFSFNLRRIFLKILNIKEDSVSNDFWSSSNEKKDFFLFLALFQVIVFYFSARINLCCGWRHFLFLNFFIAYYASIGIYFIYLKIKEKKIILRASLILLLFFMSELVYKLYIYHPYQSVYFNNLINKQYKKNFEVDTQSLSRSDAIKQIIKDDENSRNIVIGTASFTPLENGKAMIPKRYWERLVFSGTARKEKADYIYTNHYFDVDIRYNKKYSIPENFYLFKEYSIDNTIIYSIYKNKDR